MKIIKVTLTIFLVFTVVLSSYFYFLRKYAKSNETKIFFKNIITGKKNQFEDSPFPKFESYSFEALKTKEVIDMADNKAYKMSKLLNHPNLFINFCFVSSGYFEVEMLMIQAFYDKFKNKINFVILSQEEPEDVRSFLNKHNFTVPFYVLKNDKFPVDIKVFPTSHLVINNKTVFMYAGVGYFDNERFNQYIESILTKNQNQLKQKRDTL